MKNNNIMEKNKEKVYNTESNIKQIKKDIQDIGEYIREILNRIKRRISFNEYLKMASDYFDEKILEIEKDESLYFVAGKCKLSILSEKRYLYISTDLYFKNGQDEWIQRTTKGKTPLSDFDEVSQRDYLSIIYKEGMEIEIEPPRRRR